MPALERIGGSKLTVGIIRKPDDVEEIVSAGAQTTTITPKVLKQMACHPKTEETILEFDNAWKEFVAKKHLVLPARKN